MSLDRIYSSFSSGSSNSDYDVDVLKHTSNTSFVSYSEEIICRLCHKINTNKIMIVPCMCNELNEMVCTDCLSTYRKNSYNSHAMTHCTLCGYRYNYNTNYGFNISNANKLYYAILSFEIIKFLMLVMLVVAAAIFLNIILDFYFSNYVNYLNITLDSRNIAIVRGIVLAASILIISNLLSIAYLLKLIIQYQFNKSHAYYRVNTENYFTIVQKKFIWLLMIMTFPVSINLFATTILFCRIRTHTFNNCYHNMYVIKNKLLT